MILAIYSFCAILRHVNFNFAMYGAEILFRKNEFDFKDIVKIAKKNPFHKISKCIITNFTIYRFLPIIKKKISFKDNTIFDYRPSPIPTQW